MLEKIRKTNKDLEKQLGRKDAAIAELTAQLAYSQEMCTRANAQLGALEAENAMLKTQAEQARSNRQKDLAGMKICGMAIVLDALLENLEMPLEALRNADCNLDVYQVESETSAVDSGNHIGDWAVVGQRCMIGGCDIPTYFADERSARLVAVIWSRSGHPIQKGLCPVCAERYRQDTI